MSHARGLGNLGARCGPRRTAARRGGWRGVSRGSVGLFGGTDARRLSRRVRSMTPRSRRRAAWWAIRWACAPKRRRAARARPTRSGARASPGPRRSTASSCWGWPSSARATGAPSGALWWQRGIFAKRASQGHSTLQKAVRVWRYGVCVCLRPRSPAVLLAACAWPVDSVMDWLADDCMRSPSCVQPQLCHQPHAHAGGVARAKVLHQAQQHKQGQAPLVHPRHHDGDAACQWRRGGAGHWRGGVKGHIVRLGHHPHMIERRWRPPCYCVCVCVCVELNRTVWTKTPPRELGCVLRVRLQLATHQGVPVG